MPTIPFIRVDLPDPLAPTTAVNDPLGTVPAGGAPRDDRHNRVSDRKMSDRDRPSKPCNRSLSIKTRDVITLRNLSRKVVFSMNVEPVLTANQQLVSAALTEAEVPQSAYAILERLQGKASKRPFKSTGHWRSSWISAWCIGSKASTLSSSATIM